MSKVIISPVKRFPGTVTLADPLTFPQFDAWSSAIEAAVEYVSTHNGTAKQAGYDALLLPGICACIERHELAELGPLTPDTFPATPRKSSALLIAWLVREIGQLAAEAEDIPNA